MVLFKILFAEMQNVTLLHRQCMGGATMLQPNATLDLWVFVLFSDIYSLEQDCRQFFVGFRNLWIRNFGFRFEVEDFL